MCSSAHVPWCVTLPGVEFWPGRLRDCCAATEGVQERDEYIIRIRERESESNKQAGKQLPGFTSKSPLSFSPPLGRPSCFPLDATPSYPAELAEYFGIGGDPPPLGSGRE